jgi:hypothetical protein
MPSSFSANRLNLATRMPVSDNEIFEKLNIGNTLAFENITASGMIKFLLKELVNKGL